MALKPTSHRMLLFLLLFLRWIPSKNPFKLYETAIILIYENQYNFHPHFFPTRKSSHEKKWIAFSSEKPTARQLCDRASYVILPLMLNVIIFQPSLSSKGLTSCFQMMLSKLQKQIPLHSVNQQNMKYKWALSFPA